MRQYHEMSELAPRDVVSRAITAEMKKTNSGNFVYLDLTHLDANLIKAIPQGLCHMHELQHRYYRGYDPHPSGGPLFDGGVKTDLHGRTSLKTLCRR
jgi:L-aspartate oxidase